MPGPEYVVYSRVRISITHNMYLFFDLINLYGRWLSKEAPEDNAVGGR